jgi:hypothetical protein
MAEQLLDAQTIREIRARLAANRPHVCDIQTNTGVRNGLGGKLAVWTPAAATVPCKIASLGQSPESTRQDAPQQVASWAVRFEPTVELSTANRLVVTDDDENVRTLVVISVRRSAMSVQAYCREATAAEL